MFTMHNDLSAHRSHKGKLGTESAQVLAQKNPKSPFTLPRPEVRPAVATFTELQHSTLTLGYVWSSQCARREVARKGRSSHWR